MKDATLHPSPSRIISIPGTLVEPSTAIERLTTAGWCVGVVHPFASSDRLILAGRDSCELRAIAQPEPQPER